MKNEIYNKYYKFSNEAKFKQNLISTQEDNNNNLDNNIYFGKNKLKKYFGIIQLMTKIHKIILLIFVVVFLFDYKLLSFCKEKIKLRKLNSDYSEITITMSGPGEKNILYANFIPLPDEIIINGNQTSSNTLLQNLENDENVVIVRWYNKLSTCEKMFYYVNYITRIDLSKFDASEVTSTANMFYQSSNIEYIDFSNFNTSSVIDMSFMFFNLKKMTSFDLSSFNTPNLRNMESLFNYDTALEHINLSTFDTSLVSNMKSLFMDCGKLTTIDLSNFRTSALTKMPGMFYGCRSLVSFDFSNFDTSMVGNMASLFFNCENLEYINFTNFKTQNAGDLRWMFYNCKKLKSLDFSNFDLSNAKKMSKMFYGCENLESINFNYNSNLKLINDIDSLFFDCKKLKFLDLSFINISSITNLDSMFCDCESLQYLNLKNIATSDTLTMNLTFAGCKSLKYLNIPIFIDNNNLNLNNTFNEIESVIYCIKNSTKAENIITILEQKNSINECSNLCFSENAKLILEKNICVDDCSKDDEYIYEYKKRCYKSCNNFYSYNKKECLDTIPSGYYLNSSSEKTINKCPDKCQLCSDESIKNNLCISCNIDYSPVINNISNMNLFIDCIKKCPSGYININDSCEIITNKENEEKEEYSAMDYLNNILGDNEDNSLVNIEDIINKIKEGITTGKLKSLLSNVTGEQKKDIEIYQKEISYQITSSYNQNNKQYNMKFIIL